MIGQLAAIAETGTVAARNGNADAATSRLIALFRITASSAANRNTLISKGSRNSAPPRPIKPPRVPITAPALKPDTGCFAPMPVSVFYPRTLAIRS
jgi:hypothetical protein